MLRGLKRRMMSIMMMVDNNSLCKLFSSGSRLSMCSVQPIGLRAREGSLVSLPVKSESCRSQCARLSETGTTSKCIYIRRHESVSGGITFLTVSSCHVKDMT